MTSLSGESRTETSATFLWCMSLLWWIAPVVDVAPGVEVAPAVDVARSLDAHGQVARGNMTPVDVAHVNLAKVGSVKR